MKNVLKGIALAGLAIAIAPSAWAQSCNTPLYDETIASFNSSTPDDPPIDFAIGGTGIVGDNFTACRDSDGIELGLRINQRDNGLIVPVANNRYQVPDGAHADGNMPWNVDVHIDMGYAYGAGIAPDQVSDLNSLILQYDCDPVFDQVNGPAYDLVALAGFFPLPLVETTRLVQLSDNTLFPGRCVGYTLDPDAEGSYEFSLTAVYDDEEVGHVSAIAVNGDPLEPPIVTTPPTSSANFSVIKTFEDGNLAEVEVSLDCNTGLILDQDKDISPWYSGELNNHVTFVLTDLGQTAASCTVSETDAPAGYRAEYTVLAGVGTADDDGCHFEDVVIGTNVLCGVTNRVDAVQVVIGKVWEGLNDDEELFAAISLVCTNVVPADAQNQWFEIVSSDDGDQEAILATVKPRWDGSTSCQVYEQNYSSAVESSGCESSFIVSVGQEDAGCTIVNTVFYEGIPTLNQYGMALLALLMLGMGFVGFRRFV
jgi:hypothetical protein